MDDTNITKANLHMQEIQMYADEGDWIKLSWINEENVNNDNSQQIQEEIKKEDLGNRTSVVKMKDNENGTSHENIESEDISDGISVITESDKDIDNTNLFQICQSGEETCEPLKILETRVNKQTDVTNIVIACTLGIVIGLLLNQLFIVPESCSVSNGIDVERLKIRTHNMIESCKELIAIKDTLNEIKAHLSVDKRISIEPIWQLFNNINRSEKKHNLDSNPYLLDQLQIFLHMSSLLVGEIDNNTPLRDKMNETLDIVNDIKTFYDNLLPDNNTQNLNPDIMRFLQLTSHNIHHTSRLLLYDVIEKMNKIMYNTYDKFNRMRYKLNEKLCHLKNTLPDGNEFLKELIENNQFLKHNKTCDIASTKLNNKVTTKRDKKANNIKTQARKILNEDSMLHIKRNKKDDKLVNHNNRNLSSDEIKNTDVPKNSFDNILMQLGNTCSRLQLTDTCSKFNTSVLTPHISKKILVKEKRIKSKDYNKSDSIVKKLVNYDTAKYKRNSIFQDRTKHRPPEFNTDYRKYQASLDAYMKEQGNQRTVNADWQFERSHAREKQRQPDASDWYFRRVYSRKNARKYMEYQGNTKSWKI